MNQSEQINELAAALAKAQGQITGALKDSSNPFFKSKYADLAACWDACRKQLSENGLSVVQTTEILDSQVVVATTLAHSSGQWMRGVLPVKAKDDGPQAQGSGITYARRYALAAIVGLAQIDDDAESAQGRSGASVSTLPPEPKIDTRKVNEYADRIKNAVDADKDGLLVDLMSEVKEAGNDFRIAVWATLPAAVKNAVKDKAPRAA
jgi:hypothetical protein